MTTSRMLRAHRNQRSGVMHVMPECKHYRRPEDADGKDCCTVMSEEKMEQKLALWGLQGLTVQHGMACALCYREETGSLWKTTKEPPRQLEELFDITPQSGGDQ